MTDALDYAIGDVRVAPDSKTLWITAEEKGVVPIFRLNADGTGWKQVFAEGTSTGIDVRGETIVFQNDNNSRPNELFALDQKTGKARQLTHFNDEFMKGITLGKAEPYWFKGADGADVHGWLVLPPNYDASKKYPLVQLLHGGPHTMNRDSWSYRWNTQVFAAAGWIVTWVNRHGSTGFSEKFSQSILNEWGDKPLEDVMKSTDILMQRFPNIDGDKLAAAGASYGGYMAAWILGHTDRFKAIGQSRGRDQQLLAICDRRAARLAVGDGRLAVGKRGRAAAEQPDVLCEGLQDADTRSSPESKTTGCHITRRWNSTTSCRRRNVPARLVVFPDENHWVLKPQNAIHWHWEMQGWLARLIGGKPTLEKPKFESKDEAKGDECKGRTRRSQQTDADA